MKSRSHVLVLVVLPGLLLMIALVILGCGTSETSVPSTSRTLSVENAPTTISAQEEFVYDNVAGEPASGPVPNDILQAAVQEGPLGQLMKYLWEHHGLVISMGNGHYVVPLPERIPTGFAWPPEVITYDSSHPRGAPPVAEFLAPDERDLLVKLWQENATIRLEQGDDGYRHIIQ